MPDCQQVCFPRWCLHYSPVFLYTFFSVYHSLLTPLPCWSVTALSLQRGSSACLEIDQQLIRLAPDAQALIRVFVCAFIGVGHRSVWSLLISSSPTAGLQWRLALSGPGWLAAGNTEWKLTNKVLDLKSGLKCNNVSDCWTINFSFANCLIISFTDWHNGIRGHWNSITFKSKTNCIGIYWWLGEVLKYFLCNSTNKKRTNLTLCLSLFGINRFQHLSTSCTHWTSVALSPR